ncbi:hypothetical protein FHX16_000001, partial [Rhizobium sp. BK661]|nr:hypothetical protein [Rhizobium sp. BK661]
MGFVSCKGRTIICLVNALKFQSADYS